MAGVTPEKLAASGTEQGIQRAICLAVINELRPKWRLFDLLYHVPNGGYRGDKESAAIAGNNLKLMGAKDGVPDLCLPLPFKGRGALYIEVKKPDGDCLPSQVAYIPMLLEARNFVAIVDDWLTGFNIIRDYVYATDAAFAELYGTTGLYDPKNRLEKASKPKVRRPRRK